MVTVDDEKVGVIVEKLVNNDKQEDALNNIAPEDMRAVFMKLCTRLRGKLDSLERQTMEISMVAWEANRLQSIRRSLADTKDRNDPDGPSTSGPTISAPPMPSSSSSSRLHSHSNSHRMAAGRDRENRDREDDERRGGGSRDRRDGPPQPGPPTARFETKRANGVTKFRRVRRESW
uniref:Uncharacterized protein n=1 Tax=Caenorhabditis japonica TaxID=281687 RepID=A0A8R1ILI2_CAEJA